MSQNSWELKTTSIQRGYGSVSDLSGGKIAANSRFETAVADIIAWVLSQVLIKIKTIGSPVALNSLAANSQYFWEKVLSLTLVAWSLTIYLIYLWYRSWHPDPRNPDKRIYQVQDYCRTGGHVLDLWLFSTLDGGDCTHHRSYSQRGGFEIFFSFFMASLNSFLSFSFLSALSLAFSA